MSPFPNFALTIFLMALLFSPSSLLSLQPPLSYSSSSTQVQCLKKVVFTRSLIRNSLSPPSGSSSSSSAISFSSSNSIPQVVVTRERGKNKQIIKALVMLFWTLPISFSRNKRFTFESVCFHKCWCNAVLGWFEANLATAKTFSVN